ncbi:hypothetical protein U27_05265 [Candidatus Vecturithrix granuli]|uniref:Uncharacterized protein n=1 Tax=Vecturithrix granuli TaxID=1499967 RepID=A0A081C137_VECG1|nr:hypothetical protein U27_05265 [Candidatus Vecturithrix granuli]
MPTQHSRFLFEQATAQDSDEILHILEEASFKGHIALIYTRRPDAYWSFKQEGDEVDIIVARDTQYGKIAGFGACAIRNLFVNGIPTRVGYLFGLRVARTYLKKFPILHRGYAYLRTLHQTKHVACYITTILEENLDVQAMLEKHRVFMPTYQPFGKYEIFALRTGRPLKSRSALLASCSFRQATMADLPLLVAFLHEQGRQMQFFPVITETALLSGVFPDLGVKDFWVMQDAHGEFLAVGALWDQRSYKQYLLQGYGGYFRCLYPFTKLLPLFGFPALPAPGSILAFCTLSFWAVKDQNPEIFSLFLEYLAYVTGSVPFFLIGVHESHPLGFILQKRPHISYRSKMYLVFWEEQQEFINTLRQEDRRYLECGLL